MLKEFRIVLTGEPARKNMVFLRNWKSFSMSQPQRLYRLGRDEARKASKGEILKESISNSHDLCSLWVERPQTVSVREGLLV